MKIFKYFVPIQDSFSTPLPEGAEILSFQCQNNELFFWALVNDLAKLVDRYFVLRGTGHKIYIPRNQLKYIGTAQSHGQFVWHLFEDIT